MKVKNSNKLVRDKHNLLAWKIKSNWDEMKSKLIFM